MGSDRIIWSTNKPLNEIGKKSAMMEIVSLPLHPILFTLYPALALLSENIDQVSVSDSYRSLSVVFLIAGIFLVLFRFVLGSWHGAAVLSTLALILFFSYGHVYTALKTFSVAGVLIGRHRYLIVLWAGLFLVGTWWVVVRARDLRMTTVTLNLIGIAALLPASLIVANDSLRTRSIPKMLAEQVAQLDSGQANVEENLLPDIYYIVPDSYSRADILLERYGFDNSGFVEFLEEEGFYVADESAPNYLWTHLSLASSMNMQYLDDVALERLMGIKPDWSQLIKDSRLRQELQRLGYSTVAFATGWHHSEFSDADYMFTPDMTRFEILRAQAALTSFEGMLMHTSAVRILEDLDQLSNTPVAQFMAKRQLARFDIQREIILGEFENLKQVPAIAGPKFVFAHIISPHVPYMFGPNGEEITNSGPFTLASQEQGEWNQQAELYIGQLRFVSAELQDVVETILDRSDRPVIIILQSDHGHGLGLDWEDPEADALMDKMAILNAYYVPERCRASLYPKITPVNSFRLVLSCALGLSYPPLADITYVGHDYFAPAEEFLGNLR